MAHSSFIDSDVVSSLTETYISESDLKVEIETHHVNDDENVAVEVLGQLGGSGCDVDIEVPIVVKTEDAAECSYVEDVRLESTTKLECGLGEEENVSAHAVVLDIGDGELVIADEDPGPKLVMLDDNISAIVENDIAEQVANPFDVRDNYLMCSICGFNKFTDNVELQTHMYVVHNNNYPIVDDVNMRPYSCDSCHMNFQRKSSLKNHSKIHSHGNLKAVDEFSYSNGKETNGVQPGPINKRKRRSAVNKDSSTRIPPFETLKPNSAAAGFPAVQAVDNLFNSWRMDDRNSVTSNGTGVISVKPMSELTSRNEEAILYPEDTAALPSNDTHSKDKPYTCPFCTRAFAREKAMLNHIRIHNDNYDLTLDCQRCHTVFEDILSLQSHLLVCVLPESMTSLASEVIEQPKEDVEPPVEFQPVEASAFPYNSHNHANVGDHVCKVCHKRFKTRQKVFRHMWVHRKKIYTCEICGLPFPGIKYLDEHRLSLHPSTGPFTCLQCGKSFMSKQGLTEHGRLHKGWSEQYYCNYCQKYFSSRQGYTIHGRIHTGERPYGCKFCPKFFRDGGTLKKHERIHTGERPHECPLCHKKYNQKVVLREHIRGVHVMKKNSEINSDCPICDISNLGKDELSEHIVRHSDELMKKAKQDFVSKKKSLKSDNRILNRRRRVKKTSLKENHVTDKIATSNDDSEEAADPNDVDFVHSYKVQPKEPQQPRVKRKITKKLSFDIKNQAIKKKADRLKTRKATTTKIMKKKKPTTTKQKKHKVKKTINDKKNVDETNSLSATKKETKGGVNNDVSKKSNSKNVSNKNSLDDCDDVEDEEEDDDVYSPPVEKLQECEMCHEKFSTRNELLAHVFVHI